MNQIIRNDEYFVRNVILESSKNTSSNLEAFLNECLKVGRDESRKMFLITEAVNPQPPNLDQAILNILKKHDQVKSAHLQNVAKTNPAASQVLSQIQQRNVQPSQQAYTGAPPPVIQQPQAQPQQQPPVIQQPQAQPQQQTPKQSEQIKSVLSNLIGNMLIKLEKTAGQFANKLTNDELTKTFDSTIRKLTPIIKREDKTQVDTLKKYFYYLVQKNPGYASVIVGILVNATKVAVGASGSPAVGALGAGVVVGMILRTLVGRMKNPKEDWKTAAKNAAKVTTVSVLSGAALKGIFGLFSGNGFMSGVKSYFGGGHGPMIGGSKTDPEQLKNVFDSLKINPGAPPHDALRQVIGKSNYNKIIDALAISDSTNSELAAERKLDHMLTRWSAGIGREFPQQLAQMLDKEGLKLDLPKGTAK